jgi:mono/diheme cytochrome c family protein
MRRLLMTVALAALAAGCASLDDARGRRDAAAGRQFAQRACAGCHATGLHGYSPNPRSPPFRTLGGRLPGAALETRLSAIVRDGHGEMPPIYMTPQEMGEVAAYIRALRAVGQST